MNNRRDFIKLTGALLLAGCGSSSASNFGGSGASNSGAGAPIVLDPAPLSARLQADTLAVQAAGNVPGVNVGIWTPASSWIRSFGLATVGPDRALAQTDNFSWRSVTKSMTVTIVLQLLAERGLSLDSPVNRFLSGIPGEASISIRNLAEMSSGLFEYPATDEVRQALAQDPLRHYSVSELVVPALAHGLHFQPGSQYEYCNTNTLLLGMVAEALSGSTIDELMVNRIFQPLGMTRTAYLQGVDRPTPATLGYDFVNGAQVETKISHSALGAAGAVAGPLEDARTWAAALTAGTLSPARFQSDRLRFRAATNGPIYDGYGLGFGTVQGWLGHTGEGVGYALGFFGEPLSGSQIVILMNGSNISNQPLRLLRRFLSTLAWPIPVPADARP